MIVCAPHLGLRPGSDLGGEVSERALLERLALAGDTIQLLLPPEAEAGPAPPGWRVRRWSRRRARRWWRSNGAAARAMDEAFREQPFDLAHVHSGLHFGRGALAARRRLRARFPIVVHHHHLEGSLLERTLEAAACRGADAVVVPSRFAAQSLAEAGGPGGAGTVVIPRGVDLPDGAGREGRAPRPARDGLRRPEGRRVILSIGRLIPRKNPLLLVEALAAVERAQPGAACLRLLGAGPLQRSLARRARTLGIAPLVELPGRCDAERKWRELRACAVFATASDLEGFGLAAAEAMAAGAPVVAPRAAAFPELIEDGRSGLLVAPGDAHALAATFILLLNNPGKAEALGAAAARRVATEFSWDTAARRLRSLYQELTLSMAFSGAAARRAAVAGSPPAP